MGGASGAPRDGATVPRALAEAQAAAYRHAFREAVRRAEEAVRQRDFYRTLAFDCLVEADMAAGIAPAAAKARAARRMERADFEARCLP